MAFRWVQGSHNFEAVNSSGVIRHPMGGVFSDETLFRTLISIHITEIFATVSSTQAAHRRIPIVWGVCAFPLSVTPPAAFGPQQTPDEDWILTGQMRPTVETYIWDSTGSPSSGYASWATNPDVQESEARRQGSGTGDQYWVFCEGAGTDAVEVSANQFGRLWYRQLIST
jgi:hypothetical protein